MYSQYIQFVFRFELAHSSDSDRTVTETQTNRQGMFLFTFLRIFSVVFLQYNREKCEPNKHYHQYN